MISRFGKKLKTLAAAMLLLWIQSGIGLAAPVLKIHQSGLWQAMLNQVIIAKFDSPTAFNHPITLDKPDLRVDLTLHDLIDQVEQIIEEDFPRTRYQAELENALRNQDGKIDRIRNFERWFDRLNRLASEDERLKAILNQGLILQFYHSSSIALKDNISFYRLARIRTIDRYNSIASEPESAGIFSKLRPGIPMTVTAVQKFSRHEIKSATRSHLEEYASELESIDRIESTKCDTQDKTRIEQLDADRIFRTVESLPEKTGFLESIDRRMHPALPKSAAGSPVLPRSYILCNGNQLIATLKDLTWEKLLNQEDDQILLQLRRWMKRNRANCTECVRETLNRFNEANQTKLNLPWLDRRGLPRRSETIETYPILEKIYGGNDPWQKTIDTVLTNRRGNRVMIGYTRTGAVMRKTGDVIRNAVKSENLAGAAAGTGALLLSQGNFAIAFMTNSVVKDLVSNRKYDHQARELLTKIPLDIAQGLLAQTGFQPGRFFNLLGLGAGYGFTQGLITKQDPFKSALVGAAVEGGIGMLPANLQVPVVSGTSRNTLVKNAAIEVFTTTAKASIRGGIVAVLDKKDFVKGMATGAAYGAGVSTLKILILGTRYHPLSGHDAETIDQTMHTENEYTNSHGAPGGNYQIDRNMIRGTAYRTGGALPKMIRASITLPGNVSMLDGHFDSIEIIVHEAHHLSQQEQLGLIRFYVDYLLESMTTSYYDLSFEISAYL
jgi:hypothetical protein